MKILMLGPSQPELAEFLAAYGDEVVWWEDRLTGASDILRDIDLLVSYGYRHLLKADVLEKFPARAINLHISLLPWNRGADPNLWSFLEDTPKGVTIHYIDTGLDTGAVLAQEEVGYDLEDTLRTSYKRLAGAIEELFKRKWPEIREDRLKAVPQSSGGSYHCLRDREKFEHLLTDGWDTPVSKLIGKALRMGGSQK